MGAALLPSLCEVHITLMSALKASTPPYPSSQLSHSQEKSKHILSTFSLKHNTRAMLPPTPSLVTIRALLLN